MIAFIMEMLKDPTTGKGICALFFLVVILACFGGVYRLRNVTLENPNSEFIPLLMVWGGVASGMAVILGAGFFGFI